MFNWATLKLQCRRDLDGCRVLINKVVEIQPELRDHRLVKALRGEEEAVEAAGGVRGPVVTDARPRRTDPERDKCIR